MYLHAPSYLSGNKAYEKIISEISGMETIKSKLGSS